MKVQYKDFTYAVKFEYHDNGRTFCHIGFITGEPKRFEPILSAGATCSEKDEFRRSEGRKIAFSRAIKQIPDREARRVFWKAFFSFNKVFNKKNKKNEFYMPPQFSKDWPSPTLKYSPHALVEVQMEPYPNPPKMVAAAELASRVTWLD